MRNNLTICVCPFLSSSHDLSLQSHPQDALLAVACLQRPLVTKEALPGRRSSAFLLLVHLLSGTSSPLASLLKFCFSGDVPPHLGQAVPWNKAHGSLKRKKCFLWLCEVQSFVGLFLKANRYSQHAYLV